MVRIYIHTGFIKASSWLYFYNELSYYAIRHKYEVFTSQAEVITTDMARHFSLSQQPKQTFSGLSREKFAWSPTMLKVEKSILTSTPQPSLHTAWKTIAEDHPQSLSHHENQKSKDAVEMQYAKPHFFLPFEMA